MISTYYSIFLLTKLSTSFKLSTSSSNSSSILPSPALKTIHSLQTSYFLLQLLVFLQHLLTRLSTFSSPFHTSSSPLLTSSSNSSYILLPSSTGFQDSTLSTNFLLPPPTNRLPPSPAHKTLHFLPTSSPPFHTPSSIKRDDCRLTARCGA